ncbi:hypothetical protein SEA_A3WALLY_263 [Microbacterium phage A3Wally]|nr:hypothetical protein SEA_A3WALLY_263 [Microbacterium phage A3Wally]
MTEPKTLTGSSTIFVDESAEPITFDFSGTSQLHIMSCAPVKVESGFWRKVVPVGDAA